MNILGLIAKAKPAVDDGGGSLIPAAMGFFICAFLVAIIASVVSSAFRSAKNSADVSINNAKKYHIALIKEQHRKKGGGWYVLFNMYGFYDRIFYFLYVVGYICGWNIPVAAL